MKIGERVEVQLYKTLYLVDPLPCIAPLADCYSFDVITLGVYLFPTFFSTLILIRSSRVLCIILSVHRFVNIIWPITAVPGHFSPSNFL